MYKLTAISSNAAYVEYISKRAKEVIHKFDSVYARKGFRIALYKLKSYEDYEEFVFIRFIKSTFR